MEILSSVSAIAPWFALVVIPILLVPILRRARAVRETPQIDGPALPGYTDAFADLENREHALSQWAIHWFENQQVPTDGPLVAVLPAPLERGIPLSSIDVVVEPTVQQLASEHNYRSACSAAGLLPRTSSERSALAYRSFKNGREPGPQRYSLQLTTKPFDQFSHDHMVDAIEFARAGTHSLDRWSPSALRDDSPLMGFSCLTVVKRTEGTPLFFSIDRTGRSTQPSPEVLALAPAGMLHPEPGARTGSNALARMLVSEMADAFPGESSSNLLRCVSEQRIRPYLLGFGLNPLTRVMEMMFAMIIEPSVLSQSFVAALTDGHERQASAIRTHAIDRIPDLLLSNSWGCGASATLHWAAQHGEWIDTQIENLAIHTTRDIFYAEPTGDLFSAEEIEFLGISPTLVGRIERLEGVFLRPQQEPVVQEVARCDLPSGVSLLSVMQTPLDPGQSEVDCNVVSVAVYNGQLLRDPADRLVMVCNRVTSVHRSDDFTRASDNWLAEQQSILRAWVDDIESSGSSVLPAYRANRAWPTPEPRGKAVEYQSTTPAPSRRDWTIPATIDIRSSSLV